MLQQRSPDVFIADRQVEVCKRLCVRHDIACRRAIAREGRLVLSHAAARWRAVQGRQQALERHVKIGRNPVQVVQRDKAGAFFVIRDLPVFDPVNRGKVGLFQAPRFAQRLNARTDMAGNSGGVFVDRQSKRAPAIRRWADSHLTKVEQATTGGIPAIGSNPAAQRRQGLDLSQQARQRFVFRQFAPFLVKQGKPGVRPAQREFTPVDARAVNDHFVGFITASRPAGPDMIGRDAAPETVYDIKISAGKTGHDV